LADPIPPLSDPERPEPELTWRERRSERQRLRAVRSDRRRQLMSGVKERTNRAKGKDRKKDKKRK
jgi:hypothetical protein